ncbi:MAG: nuclear transport factor 2 family protein [Rhodobacteraceae bacterium]|nr:nuclear transport factor 2 family protein [Paracoccaceae bacterium]
MNCAIGDRLFTDWLTLLKLEGRWQVISKVFHYEIRQEA